MRAALIPRFSRSDISDLIVVHCRVLCPVCVKVQILLMSIVGDDLTFASFQEKEQAPAPQSTPLPPVNLPAFPRPSLSPAQSKVQQKRAVADPGERRGLDLNTPVSPTRQDSSRVYGNMASYSGADSLEDVSHLCLRERGRAHTDVVAFSGLLYRMSPALDRNVQPVEISLLT